MATLEQLTTRLAAAEEAYDALMVGTSARVVVDASGERVEYTAANSTKLEAYIEKLKIEIAYFGQTRRRGPAGAVF